MSDEPFAWLAHGSRGLTSVDIGRYLQALQRDPCAFCWCPPSDRVLDHIEPTRRGGSNGWWNLTAVCSHCNAQKGVVSLLGFLGWRNYAEERAITERVLASLRSWRKL